MFKELHSPILRNRRVTYFLLLFFLATNAFVAGELPALRRYRELKIYSTSAPDTQQPERIVAQTQFVNEGPIPIRIRAQLDACESLGFKGAEFDSEIPPGQNKLWKWNFTVRSELRERQILTGSININRKRERDLYISVQ